MRYAQEFREQAYFEKAENTERMPIGSCTYPHPCSHYFEQVNQADVLRIKRNTGSQQREEDKRKQRTVEWKQLSGGFKLSH